MSQLSASDSQFSCSICLGLLRDPVTVPCGHSYCMICLTNYWDRERVSTCPQCRATFSPRPTLGRNILLAEMLQKLRAVSLTEGPSAPPLCDLMNPAEHQGFQHATFDVNSVRPEVSDGQRFLGETRRRVSAQITERESEVQKLKQSLRSFSALAKAAVKDSSRIFSELLQFVEQRRVQMKELIRAQEKAEVTRAENHLQHLERQISDLRRKEAELERLSQCRDQDLITQVCQSSDGLTSEVSSSMVVSPHVSFGPVRIAVSDLKEKLQSVFHTEFTTVTSAVKTVNLLQIENNYKAGFSASVPSLDNRSDLLQYFCPLTLDPFTAHNELTLTEGNRVVSRTGQVQNYPDHSDRFDTWGQVLCRESLQGRSYWEVEWSGQQVAVALTYESIGRKGSSDACRLGHNLVSWSLGCSSSSFSFSHRKQTLMLRRPPGPPDPPGSTSSRIGVFLDHDAGLLCFFTVTPRDLQLLHRVEAEFNQPLHAAVWLGTNSAVTFCNVD